VTRLIDIEPADDSSPLAMNPLDMNRPGEYLPAREGMPGRSGVEATAGDNRLLACKAQDSRDPWRGSHSGRGRPGSRDGLSLPFPEEVMASRLIRTGSRGYIRK